LLLLGVTLVISAIVYYFTSPPVQVGRKFNIVPERGQGHLSLLLALLFFVIAWRYRLRMFALVYSPRGVVVGAGYSDVHAQLPALWILLAVSLAIAALFMVNIFLRRSRLLVYGIGTLVAASILVGSIYPGIIQQFVVEPNEFEYEKPYLDYNISFTQQGFNLNAISRREFPAEQILDWSHLEAAQGTIDNVRLWDYRPIQQTFSQLQEIRPYYNFIEVDTDRYMLDGQMRQVMLSARELDPNATGSQTWVNRRLQYTHGYGVTMAPVSEARSDNLPVFIARDLPQVTERGLEINNPRIYYGEVADDYVIVNTDAQEFDYSVGDTNAYFTYDGSGGVPVGSVFRRLLYAIKFGDYQILFSGNVNPDSRVMFDRKINTRLQKVAPFLVYDDDPYVVALEDRLYWIQDAYTVSRRYPYSQIYSGVNYIRNSVKVVIDAYNGSLDFYIVDPEDPVVESYARIFPELFRPMEEMPAGLKQHLRYPEDLFSLQSRVYLTYHMEDTRVFYNKEDVWAFANEVYAGNTQPVEAYYTMLQLPGEEEEEFVIMLPFTPANKQNMVAWMAARSDPANYGELIVFLFPRGKLISGPMQVEAYVDQDTTISQQLSLWDQRGSNVIRGNLLVLPVDDSILYIEPLYLQAAQSQLPELARVIVSYNENVVMETSLDRALVAIFGEREQVPPEEEPPAPTQPPAPGLDADLSELAARASELYDQAQSRLAEGDWAGYGELMEELRQVLEEMNALGATTDQTA